jgi:membrane fusion protein (multidrug efflux system)
LEYQSAKTELEKTNLVAASDGYVGAVETDKGAFVTPQDKIAHFVDIQDVYVEFGIIEKDIAKVREGQNVEVTVESYGDEIFKGQVDSVSPIVEGRSRTLRVRSKLSNVDEKIKPGMFGRVNLLVYEKEDALVIPSSSFKKKR